MDQLKNVKRNPVHDDEVCYAPQECHSLPPHIEVASDREAMKMALQEFIVRLMFEHGEHWAGPFSELLWDAEHDAKKEFKAAKIIKESEAPF